MGIFVETVIRAPMEALWSHCQDPAAHQRWDVRFSTIEYLPKGRNEPQRFRYATRMGFGLVVAGVGETVASRDLPGGARASSIRFSSLHPLSLIREGSGYWKYAATPDGVRFATWYDYRTRHGRLGAVVDRFAFRPLMGWATAWSFDRLRLWLERGIPPAASARAAAVHTIARLGLAAVFVYHGLVPKLLWPDPAELAMLGNTGVPEAALGSALVAFAVVELALAVVLVAFWHRRWPAVAAVLFAVAASTGVALSSPDYLRAAFNPGIVNIAVAALAVIDLLALPDAPDAGRCRRRPVEGDR
jgi:hypothetical protein